MLYKNIMVAYDGSDPSTEALVVAKDLIDHDPEATLHIVTIVAVGSLGIGADSTFDGLAEAQQVFPDMSAYDQALINAKELAIQSIEVIANELIPNADFKITKDAVIATKAADGICKYATDNKIDMIVMGRRGLGALGAMLGSVSYSVLHKMSIPVVTVR